VGGLGPLKSMSKKKRSSHIFFHSPISIIFSFVFPSLFLPPPQSLNIKEIFFSWEAPFWWEAWGPGPMGLPLNPALWPVRDCVKNNYFKYQKKSLKVVIFHVCMGCPHPTDCDENLHICLITNVINHDNYGGCMLSGLISVKGRI
jgi:hypothetical protein